MNGWIRYDMLVRFSARNDIKESLYKISETKAAVGVEPTNNGFANRRLRPLGYAASAKTRLY